MIAIMSLGIGVLSYYLINLVIGTLFSERITIQGRLAELETEDIFGSSHRREGELGQRVIRPFLEKIINFFALFIPMDEKTTENINAQLLQAGFLMKARQYRASVILFTILCTLTLFFYGVLTSATTGRKVLFGLFGAYTGIVLSRFHLKSKITSRKNKIYYQFPSVMDLLSVCVTAGLGFDQAVSYIVKRMEGPLIEELKTLLRELSMGTPRHEGLNRFAKRCDLQEVDVFVSAVNQAEELGSPLSNILETQAASIRYAYKQKTEEQAQKISIKMILPMVLFILPVVFIIILGPVVPSIMAGLGDF